MEVAIVQETCIRCGITFWITSQYQQQLINCHNGFCCPKGHTQYYSGKNDAEKYKEEANRLDRQLTTTSLRLSDALRSNSALRGRLTRMKKAKK